MIDLVLFIVVYLVSGLFLEAFCRTNKKKKIQRAIWIGISASLPILLLGLRYNVGTDYLTYIEHYYWYGRLDILQYLNISIEILHYAIIKIAHLINDNYQTMFFIYAVLTIFFIYKGILIVDNKNKSLMLFVYFFIYFAFAYNGMRQGLAVAIILYAYSIMFYQNKRIKPIILGIIAILIHKSALIILPIYLINLFAGRKMLIKHRYIIYVYIIFIVLFGNMLLPEIFSNYGQYYNNEETQLGIGLLILKAPLIIIALYLINPLIKQDENNKIYIMFLILELLTAYLGYQNAAMARIALYFSITKIILVANMVDLLKNQDKKIMKIGIVSYCIVYFISEFYIKGYHQIFPYEYQLL